MTASPKYRVANDKFRERFDSLPDKLRAHIYRVRDVGLELASRHGIDEERAELGHTGTRRSAGSPEGRNPAAGGPTMACLRWISSGVRP